MEKKEKKAKVVTEEAKKNLKPLNRRSPEEVRAITSKGGRASAVAKRKRRDMRLLAEALLNKNVSKSQKTIREKMAALGLNEEDMVYANAVLAAMLIKAANGDVNAAKFIRDTAGFAPEEKVSVDAAVSEKSDVLIYLPEIEKDDDDDDSDFE